MQMPTRNAQILSRVGRSYPTQRDETYGISTEAIATIVTAAGRSRKQLIRKITHSHGQEKGAYVKTRKLPTYVGVVDQTKILQ
jgi:hypothetical protein